MAYLTLPSKRKKLLPDAFRQHRLPLKKTFQKEPSGRPPTFNDRKRRELGRVARANRRATLKEIRQLISTKACENTIRNELKKIGYASRVAVRKPFLNEKQQKVFWTDESSFEIGKLSLQPRVWRKTLVKYDKECLAPTFKSGQNFNHDLGHHSWWKEVETCLYEERHEDNLDSPVLMEDGAPIHRAKIATE
ncbi:hypothetical protein G6F70_004633 [Rhizopus microsporus]|nr:hypothetical protein G6F70_004633 [Rhizopus microsporus]